MDKQTLKHVLYASIAELAKDRKYYYYSDFGEKYCHFTEEGEKAVIEILQIWTAKILEEEKRSLDKRAKDLVIKGLKGGN